MVTLAIPTPVLMDNTMVKALHLEEDFLKFEHTDGLNFINIDQFKFHELWTSEKVTFNVLGGLGAGILLPRTDATLWVNLDMTNSIYQDMVLVVWQE